MKFLLSNGHSTNSVIDYVSDVIYLNLNIYVDEIPNSRLGVSEIIDDATEETVISSYKSKMEDILTTLRRNLPGLEITLGKISVSNNSIAISVSINNVIKKYEISGPN